ncbi:holin [Enterococcus phage vB_EfaS_Ef5.2]|uniref:Holin n=3 Tax=Efquatrovirus TaxID=2560124 RepID=A0A7U3RNH2_9CAUD|nr:holin [Enterococcus phage EfaCPT1]YP_009622344.1 holin [Enterococcus phage PMBT2]AWY03206.1 holin [Enterococcus phage LY0323]MBS6191348.1 phage holin [Haemophilus parainfluenzae]MBS6544466.1 phage holin [Veillonella sp.]QAX97290.1 holin [Enterococcus phage vB_EfaS_Max]QBZ69893.1 holin [Enterococcus phage vB_EfaS_Ef5.1]QBZ69961.1 holin [Enterococcus phage vB_EfaS_Ef5.2]QMS41970.1 holin [Enterococcus phage vB_EFaS_TV217]QNL31347.1 holin [Enterococcus phage vB_EFaS_TV54]
MDWKTRIRSKAFWITLVPAVVVLIQMIGNIFGLDMSKLTGLSEQLIGVINALFVVLSILGIAVDPTTKGIKDNKEENK